MPIEQANPPADYCAIVSPYWKRPHADLYAWPMRSALPMIKIPLEEDDADVDLNLQAAFTAVYDRAGYDYTLSYAAPVEPPVSEEDAKWLQEVLAARMTGASETPA